MKRQRKPTNPSESLESDAICEQKLEGDGPSPLKRARTQAQATPRHKRVSKRISRLHHGIYDDMSDLSGDHDEKIPEDALRNVLGLDQDDEGSTRSSLPPSSPMRRRRLARSIGDSVTFFDEEDMVITAAKDPLPKRTRTRAGGGRITKDSDMHKIATPDPEDEMDSSPKRTLRLHRGRYDNASSGKYGKHIRGHVSHKENSDQESDGSSSSFPPSSPIRRRQRPFVVDNRTSDDDSEDDIPITQMKRSSSSKRVRANGRRIVHGTGPPGPEGQKVSSPKRLHRGRHRCTANLPASSEEDVTQTPRHILHKPSSDQQSEGSDRSSLPPSSPMWRRRRVSHVDDESLARDSPSDHHRTPSTNEGDILIAQADRLTPSKCARTDGGRTAKGMPSPGPEGHHKLASSSKFIPRGGHINTLSVSPEDISHNISSEQESDGGSSCSSFPPSSPTRRRAQFVRGSSHESTDHCDQDDVPMTDFKLWHNDPVESDEREDAETLTSEHNTEAHTPAADSEDYYDLSIDLLPPATEGPTARGMREKSLRALIRRRRRMTVDVSSPHSSVDGMASEHDELEEDSEPAGSPSNYKGGQSENSITNHSESCSELTDDFIIDDTDDAPILPSNFGIGLRSLREHFDVFVHYLVASMAEPDILSMVSRENKIYFESARRAISEMVEGVANKIAPSTWKAPFRYTLEKRTHISSRLGGSLSGNGCDACWQRGKEKYCCTTWGVYTLSTQEGIRSSDTSPELTSEVGVEYTTMTHFDNNALAPKKLYPPNFDLVIGGRCSYRALNFHKAVHYCYNLFNEVKDKVDDLYSVKDEGYDLPSRDNFDDVFDLMRDRDLIQPFWVEFEALIEKNVPQQYSDSLAYEEELA